MPKRLKSKADWVFDLDNTLYPASCDLFAQIDARMTDFVARTLELSPTEARALQKRYYADYGTTLSGLMKVHGLKPAAFLEDVHRIDLSALPRSDDLYQALDALPGRKFVFTNGSRGHAEGVTRQMGLDGLFDGIFAIEDAQYEPKPAQGAFDRFIDRHDVDPQQAVFFEDLPRNLAPAHALGFATVLVQSGKDWSHEPAEARPSNSGDDLPAHVHYVTSNLTAFLSSVA